MRPYFIILLLKRIRNIGYLLKDKKTSLFKKILVVFGIIYLVSPLDLIPFPVLGFSVIDDIVLWIFILSYLKDELDKYSTNNNKKDNTFKDKTIIDSVEYEIRRDKEGK